MKALRFTRRAQAQLEEILFWTLQNFGLSQADRYRTELLAAAKTLAGGQSVGRSCSALVPEDQAPGDLRYYLAGRHYLIFRAGEEEIEIVDIVHGARDLPGILNALSVDED